MTKNTRPCEICGKMIDPERADALPGTRLCTEHAQQADKFGGEIKLTATEIGLSKPGSMRGNRGDVAITGKQRNIAALDRLHEQKEREQEGSN
jgi:hypothetical protein